MKPWKFLTSAYVDAVCTRERFPVTRLSTVCGWVGEDASMPRFGIDPMFDVGLEHAGHVYVQESDRLAWRRRDVDSLAAV